jgi:uncharacterized cupredoxin-like copper-binding protein
MKFATLTAIATLAATTAFGAGSHEGSHNHSEGGAETGHMMEMMEIGMPGMMGAVDRTIDVIMRETDDGEMIFEPAHFNIRQGETIRFNVVNGGELEHEFVIDTLEGNAKHKELMAKFDMEHDDPNSIRLDPGQSGEIVWQFANPGAFEFACLIPGHYESGMHGPISVGEQMAQADVEYSTGQVKKIDRKTGKVTIIHGPLVNLDMPAMTMVFRADEALIANMSEGQDIEFMADRVKGKLTVTKLK